MTVVGSTNEEFRTIDRDLLALLRPTGNHQLNVHITTILLLNRDWLSLTRKDKHETIKRYAGLAKSGEPREKDVFSSASFKPQLEGESPDCAV
jgi:hypothetical protein